jgi:N-terminal acetyltransferase B complex non-catalytic subunit
LEELAEKKKVLEELETVELYDEAFEEVLPGSQESWGRIIGELRWLCVKAQPKNEDLSLKCFQACLGKDDLEHSKQVSLRILVHVFSHSTYTNGVLLQISNSLEKTFPKSHPYVFWNIATMFLYSVSD